MMEVNTTPVSTEADELSVEQWGDGDVVVHDGDTCGAWMKYDPQDPLFDLKNWR